MLEFCASITRNVPKEYSGHYPTFISLQLDNSGSFSCEHSAYLALIFVLLQFTSLSSLTQIELRIFYPINSIKTPSIALFGRDYLIFVKLANFLRRCSNSGEIVQNVRPRPLRFGRNLMSCLVSFPDTFANPRCGDF